MRRGALGILSIVLLVLLIVGLELPGARAAERAQPYKARVDASYVVPATGAADPADDGESLASQPPQEFLYRQFTGPVWVGETLVFLGMMAAAAGHPLFRLSPELETRLSPLVNRIDLEPGERRERNHYWRRLPELSDKDAPFVLLRLERKESQKVGKAPLAYVVGVPTEMREIRRVDVSEVEFIAPRWRSAWAGLTEVLRDLPAESRKSVSAEKKRRLRELVESGAEQLRVMAEPAVEEEWKELVKNTLPDARIVTAYQEQKAAEWGKAFAAIVNRIDIHPSAPLPGEFQAMATATPAVPPATFGQSVSLDRFGLRVRPIDAAIAAEKMIIGGVVLEEVLPRGEELGFKKGDIILDCGGFAGDDGFRRSGNDEFWMKRTREMISRTLENAARRRNHPLHVLRGDEVIEMSLQDKADLVLEEGDR